MAQNQESKSKPNFPSDLKIITTEMHTCGEAVRIIESGFPKPEGETILQKRAWLLEHADAYRKLVMFEPRGHYDMFGVLPVTPDLPEADMAVLFMHNEGYATMCGHVTIALGRYAVDRGLVAGVSPETSVVIQCPCGPVNAYVKYDGNVTSDVRFTSVPSYAYALDVEVDVPGIGPVVADITYGGCFYAVTPAARLGLDLSTCSATQVTDAAFAVTEALRRKLKLHHPGSPDLAFLFGTILHDGGDLVMDKEDNPVVSVCVFADKEVDRSPCGSGTSSRVALQYRRGVLPLGQKRRFQSGITGAEFRACALKEVVVKGAGIDGEDVIGVVTEVAGHAYYTGSNTFTVEADDPLIGGFLPSRKRPLHNDLK